MIQKAKPLKDLGFQLPQNPGEGTVIIKLDLPILGESNNANVWVFWGISLNSALFGLVI